MVFLWKGVGPCQTHLHEVSWSWKRNLSVFYTVSYLFKINLLLITVRKAEMEGYHETAISYLVTTGHEGTLVIQVCWHWCYKDCQQYSIHLHPCSCVRANLAHTVFFWTIHLLHVLCKGMCVPNNCNLTAGVLLDWLFNFSRKVIIAGYILLLFSFSCLFRLQI